VRVNCPSCRRANRDDAQFCDGCGARLELACPACGRALRPGARFCDGCGNAVAAEPAAAGEVRDPREYTPRHLAEKILHNKDALEGERKHVTVLFADLVDSTPMAERIDPEEMHQLMDQCFSHILEQVHLYEGTVNQFLGDGVLALFGAPLALEDAPRRAVLASLGILHALESMHADVMQRHGMGFQMRIGIHTGPVVVGRIGDDLRMDYTAVGDTMNLAARLEHAAQPGTTLMSDVTADLVAGFFDVRDAGALELKGKSQPVRAWEVLAERDVSGRLEVAAKTGLTPYVGRERELTSLRDAFEDARAGEGRVAFVIGDAGLGKSRLLYEFRNSLADEPHVWMEGHCSPFGRTSSFEPIRDAWRRRFGIDEQDDDDTALAKLEAAETSRGNELAWTLPFARRLLSLPSGDAEVDAMDAATRRSETVRALRERVLRAAREAPLVFLVEDLHWIDPASEEFLTFLADSVPAHRILLIFSWRPGYKVPFGDRSFQVRIPLRGLQPNQTAAMAGSLLHASGVPDALRDLIVKKAEGNPFFVEEVTQSLLEEGVLQVEEGRISLARDLSAIAVPDRIQDILMARIDRLEAEPKRAIQLASVIGREFAMRLLERISEAGERMRDVVDDLRALELIYEKAAHPELAFMFKHALTHDVAYDSVLVQRRRALHGIVGAAIEDLYADRLEEHYEALAHHFARAEQWQKALEYHARAATKAAEAYANHTAAEHCREALAIAERLGDAVPRSQRRDLARLLGEVTEAVSDFRPAGEAYFLASGFAETPREEAFSLCQSAYAFHWGHDYDRAQALLAQALKRARAGDDEAGQALAIAMEGYTQATNRGAIGHFGEALERAAAMVPDHPVLTPLLMLWMGHHADWYGDYRRARETQERGIELARGMRNGPVLIASLWLLGKSTISLGDYQRAIDAIGEGLELSQNIGDRAWKTRMLNTLGWCMAELGCPERAVELNRASAGVADEMLELGLVASAPEPHANATVNLVGNLIVLGDLGEADEQLDRLDTEMESSDDPWMRWRYTLHRHDVCARLLIARGDPEAALPLLDAELAGAREHSAAKIEARALAVRGHALVASDLHDEADEALAAAVRVARRIEYPPALWRSLALQAELDRRRGDDGQAARRVAEARELTGRLADSLTDPVLAQALHNLGIAVGDDPLGAIR
jgi:class 3 adenylate cyclase/tetratricopeptide (TPR) repeat protein